MSTEYAVTLSKYGFGDMLVEYFLATESQTVGLASLLQGGTST